VRLLVVAAVLVAYYVGTLRPNIGIHTGTGTSAEGAITLEADGWSYGVPREDVVWIDDRGTFHMSGRPDCLPATGASVTARFGAVEVTYEGSTWREVVWVDCR
jgi:hypothetical protein